VSFIQVFFDRANGDDRARAARAALAMLSDASGEVAGDGDPFLLGDTFVDQDEQSLTSQFGAAFAQALLTAEPGHWSGPIASSHGLHLVKVTAVQPSRARAFAEVRDRLTQEWHRQRQETAGAQLYADLLRKYQIVADPPVRPLLGPVIDTKARP
jgi:PPIC-type PPIASE domain